jgi:hypothetical protein
VHSAIPSNDGHGIYVLDKLAREVHHIRQYVRWKLTKEFVALYDIRDPQISPGFKEFRFRKKHERARSIQELDESV